MATVTGTAASIPKPKPAKPTSHVEKAEVDEKGWLLSSLTIEPVKGGYIVRESFKSKPKPAGKGNMGMSSDYRPDDQYACSSMQEALDLVQRELEAHGDADGGEKDGK